MQLSKLLICTILHVFPLFLNAYCDEETILDHVSPSEDELRKLHSFFFMSEENLPSSSSEAQKIHSQFSLMEQPTNCKSLSEQETQEGIFYKRLIAILLSRLVTRSFEGQLTGTFNLEASSAEFQYLQDFVKGQGSIREVDRILENIIKPGYSTYYYIHELFYYIRLLSYYLDCCFSIMKEHWDITIISCMVIVSFMILRRRRWSQGLIIFLTIDIIFIISFFITWWRLIQEAQIKLMAAQAQFTEVPIACQPHKMGMWDKTIARFFGTNDCEKYYESIMSDPRLKVTPAFVLTHFLSTIIFQPFSHFGTVISEFIENATSELSFFYKMPVMILLIVTICGGMLLLPLVLIGGSINFGIGPLFKFGIKGRRKSCERQERIDRIHEDTSPVKRLRTPRKPKRITLEQDLAGGDTCRNTRHLSEKYKRNRHCEEKEEEEDSDSDC